VQKVLRDLQHAQMTFMQWIKRAGKNNLRRAARRMDACMVHLAQQQVLPGGLGRYGGLFDLLVFEQFEFEPIGRAAGLGHDVQQQSSDEPFFFGPASPVFLKLQSPCGRPIGGLQLAEQATPAGKTSAVSKHRARRKAVIAMARAVRDEQYSSGSLPSQAIIAAEEYGTTASSKVREPPGTSNRSATARLPPPAAARTIRRGASWICSTSCSTERCIPPNCSTSSIFDNPKPRFLPRRRMDL